MFTTCITSIDLFAVTFKQVHQQCRSRSSSTTSSTISTKDIRNIVERLRIQRCRDSTRQTYHRVWKLFAKFYQKLDIKPKRWEERIVLFAGFLIEQKKLRSATVKSYLSAIRSVLQEDKIELDENQFLITSLTRACKLRNDKVITRLPVDKSLLHSILDKADKYFNKKGQIYWKILFKAMTVSAYYGMLRIGEIAKSQHVIKAINVHIGENKDNILFVLNSSKTHTEGDEPQKIKISSKPIVTDRRNTTPNSQHCPFRLINEYLAVRPDALSSSEQFFVFTDNSPVTQCQYRYYFRKIIGKLNIQSDCYTVHSLRIGRTVDLSRLGLSVETIKKIGRWKSNAVFVYLKF